MDEAESQSGPPDSNQDVDAKRAVSEESRTTPTAKRLKSFHEESTELNGGTPAAIRRVPFPEKVYQTPFRL